MSGPLRLRFLTSASDHRQLGESEVEIAVAGRSNVGKSSLLNAVANRKSLARTSKTPGATRLLNVFELEPEGSGRWLVDLPGYGFAKAPAHEQERWARMIEGYLTEREQLVISLYYREELTMKEVGSVLGLTESRVSQIHSQAVRRLKGHLSDHFGDEPADDPS